MITREQADAIAAERVASHGPAREGDEYIILHDRVIEKPYGWMYLWTSRRWHEGDRRFAIGGNGPFLVRRETGEVVEFNTALKAAEHLRRYEAAHGLRAG